ncbi:hypothetical protein BJX62DRAFT_236364 [Aspergillus germanicus]
MEEPSEGMSKLAFQVFDQYGLVKSNFTSHPVQRGTGVRGDKLDRGPLFLIEELHVTALEHRRKGLGQRIVSLLLDKALGYLELRDQLAKYSREAIGAAAQPSILHALVLPGRLNADGQLQSVGKSVREILGMNAQALDGPLKFWRKCGFQRIGASKCLAFSFDPQHPSRALAVASDFDPQPDLCNTFEDEELDGVNSLKEARQRRNERYRISLPLHHAALTLSDDECRAFFASRTSGEASWTRALRTGQTLLHITVCRLMPRSLEWLLKNIDEAHSLKAYRNGDGFTPLEVLQDALDFARSQGRFGNMRMNLSGDFEGHPENAVSCLSLLSGPASSMLSSACLRYGSTCGECLNGFLSPRMSISLTNQCVNLVGFLCNHFKDDRWRVDKYNFLMHLDPSIHSALRTSPSLLQGFVDIFQIIEKCPEEKNIPTPENILQCVNERSISLPHTQEYLQHAGTQKGCHAVLNLLFNAARKQDQMAGDGTEVDFESSEMDVDGGDFASKSSEEESELSDGLDPEDSDTAHENVEDHEYNVATAGGDIALQITLFTTQEPGSSDWVENLCAECTRDGALVAHILARLIWRGAVRREFW